MPIDSASQKNQISIRGKLVSFTLLRKNLTAYGLNVSVAREALTKTSFVPSKSNSLTFYNFGVLIYYFTLAETVLYFTCARKSKKILVNRIT